MSRWVRSNAKFLVALVGATLTSLLVALQAYGDDSGFGDLSTQDWLQIGIAVLGTAGAVWAIPNSDDRG